MKLKIIIFLLLSSSVAIAQLSLPFGGIPNTAGTLLTVNSQMPSNTAVTSAGSPFTFSFTNTAGTVLYVAMSADGALQTPTITYNGVAMTRIASLFQGTTGGGAVYMFRLITPATGANNVVITFANAATVIAAAISFTGNAATPDNGNPSINSTNLNGQNPGGANISGTNFSVSNAATSSGNILLQATCYGDAGHSTQTGTLSAFREVNNASSCNNLEMQFQSAVSGTTTSSFTNTTSTSAASLGLEVIGTSSPISAVRDLSNLPNNCQNTQGGTAGTTISCTWNAAPPAGSSLVCSGSTWNTGTGTVSGVSISDGTAFTTAISFQYVVPNKWLIIAYRFNIGVTAPGTVTMTLAGGGTDANSDLVCNAFRDNIGTPTPDGTCQATGTSTLNGAFPCGTAITTTGADYVYSHLAVTGTYPMPNSGWDLGSFIKGSMSSHLVQAAAGSITPNGMITPQAGQPVGILGFAIKP